MDKAVTIFTDGACEPIAERENAWVILERLLKWRDLCCAQNLTKTDIIATR
jgi:hypothetical protein